jgi:molybdopterin-synthase adenylyltransferase
MIDRYSRQILFSGIGKEGQKKLSAGSVVIIGCGALGTVIADILARAGVGRIKIIDRDFIERHNLQRQVLFDEEDIRNNLPKAIAAERYLKKVNSSICIEGIVADVNYSNVERFIQGADVVMDGLDNMETRYLINDACLKHDIPWVYGGAVSASGMTMTILPHETPCLRCIFPSPEGDTIMTCDTAGVISPAPIIVASLQSVEAMKILTGAGNINRDIIYIEVWEGTLDQVKIAKREDCPSCHDRFDFLDARFVVKATSLCGQNAVQILNPGLSTLSFEDLSASLMRVGVVSYNEFMLNFTVGTQEMVVFPDGRAIIKNTNDESLARGFYAKYIGS